ncbi:MAG TPA: hypothetical protein VEY88_03970 [Archangium sp.]|nr:hypothetical protein [Archangium sp.]
MADDAGSEHLSKLGQLGMLALFVLISLGYIAFALSRTPAVVLVRDAEGRSVLVTERWLRAPKRSFLGDMRAIHLEYTGENACRLVLRTSDNEFELGSWARRSGCRSVESFVTEAARALEAPRPFEKRIPITPRHIWYPLPFCLFLMASIAQKVKLWSQESASGEGSSWTTRSY